MSFKTFVIVGSHTGHTLVAALLDCHPQIIVSNRYGDTYDKDIIKTVGDMEKWNTGDTYKYSHASQTNPKQDVKWIGNPGPVLSPVDLVINVVKSPEEVAFTLKKRYKTIDKTVERLDEMFKTMQENGGHLVFYEDLIKDPKSFFISLLKHLNITSNEGCLKACSDLVNPNIKKSSIPYGYVEAIINKYPFLERYKKATAWEVSPNLFKDIYEIVPEGSTILELGSGASTGILSERYKMISIEHDSRWIGQYNSSYIHAPMKEYKPTRKFGNDSMWYDANVLRAELPKIKYDALMVDGPKGSRVGLWKYKDLFNWEVPIFFDDVQRNSVLTLVKLLCNRNNIERITIGDIGQTKHYAILRGDL